MRLFFAFIFLCYLPSATFAGEVKEVVSSNGLKAWLMEEHALPLVAVKVSFKDSGNIYDPDGKEGRANMAAALAMEGAGDLDSRAFSEALESRAIQMNFGVDEDLYNASVESLSEHKDKAFYYFGLALTNPRFDDGAITRVKSQTESIILEQETRPGYLLHRAWQEVAFGKHPYAKSAIGTKESVNGLSKSDMREYMRRYLTQENMVIAVVGDITPDELKKLMDEHLAKLPAKYDPENKVDEVQLPSKATTKVVSFDVPQTMITFGTQGLKRNDPDYFTAYVMNQILGGGGSLNAKLGVEIRQKRGLAYSVFSGLNPMAHGATWQGGFATRNEQVDEAITTLRNTLKDFADKGPTNEEFADAKNYIKGSFVLKLDSNADVADFLINMQINQLGREYLDKRNALVDAVTKEAVDDMARRLADPGKLLVVMVGKPNIADKGAH